MSDDKEILEFLRDIRFELGLLNQQVRNSVLTDQAILAILKTLVGPRATSGTVTLGGKMDITVHLSDVPEKAAAHEWTGPLGTGVEVPPIGAITWASDNIAAVTVDPNTGQLAYVAAGVANISFKDAGNSITGSGSVTVVADVAVSGTVTFA